MSASGRPRNPDLDERILDATRRLLAERGYQGLSIDAVARAAGTTRPTVYLRLALIRLTMMERRSPSP